MLSGEVGRAPAREEHPPEVWLSVQIPRWQMVYDRGCVYHKLKILSKSLNISDDILILVK